MTVSREELVEALRPFAEHMDAAEKTYGDEFPISLDARAGIDWVKSDLKVEDYKNARDLLRLEAEPAPAPADKLNQEGGDANEPRRIEPHVATPAPADTSGRATDTPSLVVVAEARALIEEGDSFGTRAKNPTTIYTRQLIEKLITALASEYKRGLADGERRGIEKAAKVAEEHPNQVLAVWDRPGGPPGNGYVPATPSHTLQRLSVESSSPARCSHDNWRRHQLLRVHGAARIHCLETHMTAADTSPQKPDTSDEACAIACMIVSNPMGDVRHEGWQRQVNDLIRALRDERNDLRSLASPGDGLSLETTQPAEPKGMETTAEELAEWNRLAGGAALWSLSGSATRRLIRDCWRLKADAQVSRYFMAVSDARAEKAEAAVAALKQPVSDEDAAAAIEALRRAITTASNDDMSVPEGEKRTRHIHRLAAMDGAIVMIERLSASLREKDAQIKAKDEALRAYERWEADLILRDEAWNTETGCFVPNDLYDRLIEIQGMRNAALGDRAALSTNAEEGKL